MSVLKAGLWSDVMLRRSCLLMYGAVLTGSCKNRSLSMWMYLYVSRRPHDVVHRPHLKLNPTLEQIVVVSFRVTIYLESLDFHLLSITRVLLIDQQLEGKILWRTITIRIDYDVSLPIKREIAMMFPPIERCSDTAFAFKGPWRRVMAGFQGRDPRPRVAYFSQRADRICRCDGATTRLRLGPRIASCM